MAFPQGINFRSTLGYVTDGSNEYAQVTGANTYPITTPQGNNVGWEAISSGTILLGNRSTSVDRRLAGLHTQDSNAVANYRIDLPSSGSYKIRAAFGDQSFAKYAEGYLKDNTTQVLTLCTQQAVTAGQFVDASNTKHTTAANWVSNNTQVTQSFSSTILRVQIGGTTVASNYYAIAHLYVESAGTNASASGGFVAVTLAPPEATASVDYNTNASASGAFAAVSITPPEATASVDYGTPGNASGAFAAITITPPEATASGDSGTTPVFTTDYVEWLSDQSAIRCILVEVSVKSGAETTRYLSNRPFKSASTDTPANTVYEQIVIGSSVRTVERMSVVDQSASMSFGDIEMVNNDGSIDSWLNDIWSNRSVKVLLGDVRWERADFEVIFNGIVEDIGSRSRDTLNLKIRDKLQRLNTPVTETTLGGTTNNKNQLIPLTFGECHNVSPLLTNPATLEYQVHGGQIERLIEVRDNGVPVTATPNLTTGKFTLAVQPFGRITASVQGDKPSATWNNTAKKIIERLVTGYGETTNRFVSGDLDTSSLGTFDAVNTQVLGVHLSQRENVLNICNQVAATVGARMVMSRAGLLKLINIELPAPGTPFEITTDDVMVGSMQISQKLPVQAGFKIGYARNWTVQESLDTRIPNEHKDLYAREWLTTSAKDATTKTDYRLDGEPEQIDTYLLTEANAATEATRLLDLFKTPRFIVSFDANARLLQLELGQAVTVTYPRFGLDAGKDGMVVGLSPDWDNATVSVEVLI
jgi:hypothetical protein